MLRWFGDRAFYCVFCALFFLIFLSQIENLQEQLRDKDKQLGNLKDRVKSLQTDSSNTDTALATLEEALSEKVDHATLIPQNPQHCLNCDTLSVCSYYHIIKRIYIVEGIPGDCFRQSFIQNPGCE